MTGMSHEAFIDSLCQEITARERRRKISAEQAQGARRIARSGQQSFAGQPLADAVEHCLLLATLQR